METSLTTIPRASSAQDSLEDRKCHRSATVDTEVSHNDNDRSNVSVDQSDTSEEILIATERTIRRRRCILFFLLLSVITFVIIDFCTTKYIATAFSSLYHWVDLHPFPGAFMLTFVAFVSTLAFIPGAILTVGCGLAYGMIMGLGKGVVVGTVVVFAGAALGSELSFIFGRYLMRDCVGRWLDRYPLLRAVDVTMKGKGFRIFFLLRLSPIIPFNALNYMAGATAITFKDYTLSLIGLLPGTILYVFVGASAGSSMEDDMHGDDVESGKSSGHVMTVRIASIVIGVVTGVLGVVAVSCYAKKELNKIIAEEGERDQEHESDTIAAVEDDEAAEQV